MGAVSVSSLKPGSRAPGRPSQLDSHVTTPNARAGTRTSSEIAPVTGERADQLLQDFLSADGTNAPWNARGSSSSRRDLAHGFRIRAAGRVG